MISHLRGLFILFITALVFSCQVKQQDHLMFNIQDIVEEISLTDRIINNRIYVPVSLEDKDYLFLFDTGAMPMVTYDGIHLSIDDYTGRESIKTVFDEALAKSFRSRKVYIGSFPMDSGPIYQITDKSLSYSGTIDKTHDGIIGVNTIDNTIVYIDIRSEKFYFLNTFSLDANTGFWNEYAFSSDNDNRPSIELDIAPGITETMTIDTGAEFSSLHNTKFDALVRHSKSRVTKEYFEGASGLYSTDITWIDNLTFAGRTHKDVEISKSTSSLLGMDILSQYIMVLDMINKKIYLKPY